MKKTLYNVLVCVLVGAAMTSCAVFKSYDRDKVVGEVRTDGIYGNAQSGDSLGLGDLSWRELFTDPTLQTLIEKALAQNTDVRNTDLQIQQVEYALKASRLAFIPSITFSANGSISKTYDPYNRNSLRGNFDGNTKTYGASLTMGWQNVNFFALRNQLKGAKVTVEQIKNARQAVQAGLVANVAKLYYNICMLDEQIELMEQTVANWKIYWDMQARLMEAGQANRAAVSSIEATYWSMVGALDELKDNRTITQTSLCTLLGEPSHFIEHTTLASFQAPTLITTGAPISILSRRPDVKEAELKLQAAFYDKQEAASAFYPSLTLSATGTFTNSAGIGIVNPGVMIGNAIASLAQPIFQNGALRARYKIAKKDIEIAKNNFVQQVVAAGNEVNTAMLEVHCAEEHRIFYGHEVDANAIAYEATRKLYENSSINYLNVITAHNALISSRMSQIGNRMDAVDATVELYLALGGGTK
jgi:NodT family efflux transporter outer membrane factor (OMF) lipoprotein